MKHLITVLLLFSSFYAKGQCNNCVQVGSPGVTQWNEGHERIDGDMKLSSLAAGLGATDTAVLIITRDSIVRVININSLGSRSTLEDVTANDSVSNHLVTTKALLVNGFGASPGIASGWGLKIARQYFYDPASGHYDMLAGNARSFQELSIVTTAADYAVCDFLTQFYGDTTIHNDHFVVSQYRPVIDYRAGSTVNDFFSIHSQLTPKRISLNRAVDIAIQPLGFTAIPATTGTHIGLLIEDFSTTNNRAATEWGIYQAGKSTGNYFRGGAFFGADDNGQGYGVNIDTTLHVTDTATIGGELLATGLADSSTSNTLYYDTATGRITYGPVTAVSGKVNYTDSAGFLPTKTYLANNYFSSGGNTWTSEWALGAVNNSAGRILVNNTNVLDFFAGGNIGIGTNGANGGYRFQVNGSANMKGDFSITKNGATSTFGVAELNNTKYLSLNIPGGTGGWRGGLVIATGIGGGATTNKYWFGNSGTLALGLNMNAEVEASGKSALLIKNSLNPSAPYTGDALVCYADDFSKYTYANNRVFAAFITGGSVGSNMPSTNGGLAPTVGLGYRYHPLTSGWASDMVVFGRNEQGVNSEIACFATRNNSVGIGISEPAEKLHVNGNIKTAAPSSEGAGAVKFGKVMKSSAMIDYWEVEIDGVKYYLELKPTLP